MVYREAGVYEAVRRRLESDSVDTVGEVTHPGDAGRFDKRCFTRAFDADNADIEISGQCTCLVGDTLRWSGDVPDINFGQVAVCLSDAGPDVGGTRVSIITFGFNDGDRSGLSVGA